MTVIKISDIDTSAISSVAKEASRLHGIAMECAYLLYAEEHEWDENLENMVSASLKKRLNNAHFPWKISLFSLTASPFNFVPGSKNYQSAGDEAFDEIIENKERYNISDEVDPRNIEEMPQYIEAKRQAEDAHNRAEAATEQVRIIGEDAKRQGDRLTELACKAINAVNLEFIGFVAGTAETVYACFEAGHCKICVPINRDYRSSHDCRYPEYSTWTETGIDAVDERLYDLTVDEYTSEPEYLPLNIADIDEATPCEMSVGEAVKQLEDLIAA